MNLTAEIGSKRLSGRIGKLIPKPVAYWSYGMALKEVRRRLERDLERGGALVPRVWARNSYVLGYLQPLVSDLDITLWYDQETSPRDIALARQSLARSKRIFPLLGESNLYFARDRELLSRNMNHCELTRDPSLAAKLGVLLERPAAAERAVFLFRMLEWDNHHLVGLAHLRRRKWGHHLGGLATLAIEDDLLERALEAISEVFEGRAQRDDCKRWLRRYLDQRRSGQGFFEMDSQLRGQPWWWAFLPNRFCYVTQDVPVLDGRLLEAFLFGYRWEIFAALTQFRAKDFHSHLERMRALFDRVVPQSKKNNELVHCVRMDLNLTIERLGSILSKNSTTE